MSTGAWELEKLLLIDQWVIFYKKVSDQRLDKMKEEIKMSFVETTITEHIFNQGEAKVEGKKDTARNLLKMGFDVKIINQATGLQEKEIKQLVNQ